jgi:catalase
LFRTSTSDVIVSSHPVQLSSHPNAPKAIGSLPIPDSLADEEYHGIDAFIFVSKSGQRQAVRYLVVPEKPVHITPEEAAKQSPAGRSRSARESLPQRAARPWGR